MEQDHARTNLTSVTTVKPACSLIFGLLFQLAQILPGAVTTSSSQTSRAESCTCCPDLQSCDCADNDSPDRQAPSPALPDSGSTLKVPLAASGESSVSPEIGEETEYIHPHAPCPRSSPVHGYTDVRMSVAFCSFVI